MKTVLIFCGILGFTGLSAQALPEKTMIAFYNLENFFDTVHNPQINDLDFTPGGIKQYNSFVYRDKVRHLARVLSGLGDPAGIQAPALIGVAEVENDTVLEDLVRHPLLRKYPYHFIHFDSPDPRGIDVALLYRPDLFVPAQAKAIPVALPSGSKLAYHTRDILYVQGYLSGDLIHVFVNHWPSRRGGERRSAPARAKAAGICRDKIREILHDAPGARILLMGDLNDDPTSPSLRKALGARDAPGKTGPEDLFNPWVACYRKGIGTLANRDAWGLFDQILISQSWLLPKPGWRFVGQGIYNQPFMVENTGRYRGYPMRTWDGNRYRGGYSDHFPTYLIFTHIRTD
ncbi:MAG TPA: endonuclease/exonuclease/phosphatase family protein [Sediminibacterium sp.]|nr:endonuclease/exonuclease/phosphatase family protein [Sediminibacterium sp.]